jgi:hypothetical protein
VTGRGRPSRPAPTRAAPKCTTSRSWTSLRPTDTAARSGRSVGQGPPTRYEPKRALSRNAPLPGCDPRIAHGKPRTRESSSAGRADPGAVRLHRGAIVIRDGLLRPLHLRRYALWQRSHHHGSHSRAGTWSGCPMDPGRSTAQGVACQPRQLGHVPVDLGIPASLSRNVARCRGAERYTLERRSLAALIGRGGGPS